MATQTDAATPEISAEIIGRAFVTRFYQIFYTTPELGYRFYNDSSKMSRPGASGDLVTVTAIEEIKDLIMSLDCTKYKAEILTADTQASHMDGVTVLVTGCLTGPDNLRKMFTESFFLAPQENGYFVHNDVFRFIDDNISPVSDSVEEHCDELALASPVNAVAPVQVTAEVAESPLENHTSEPKEETETATLPVVEERITVNEEAVPQKPVDSSLNVQPVVEASSNGDVNAPKKSYASLLMNGKKAASTFPVHVAAKPVKPKAAPKSVPPAPQQIQAASLPAASEFSAPNGSNGHASSNGHVAGKGYSIYIGHLPYDATPQLVEGEFKKFGHIKKNGIQVRTSKGYVFGFVEYEDATAQENALKMGSILIGGKKVFIEEKKTSARGDDYPSGRGGYRNDGYKRGNYSNGRGHVRNNYGDRNGDGPSCGIRNGEGYADQNGVGRGARQVGSSK